MPYLQQYIVKIDANINHLMYRIAKKCDPTFGDLLSSLQVWNLRFDKHLHVTNCLEENCPHYTKKKSCTKHCRLKEDEMNNDQ